MPIQCFIINDKRVIPCDGRGIPLKVEKTKKRKLSKKEKEVEQDFVESIAGFQAKESKSIKWIKAILNNRQPSYIETYSLTKFFSILSGILLPREVYRRKFSCTYWIEKNMEEISKALSRKSVKLILDGKVYPIVPPSRTFPEVMISKSSKVYVPKVRAKKPQPEVEKIEEKENFESKLLEEENDDKEDNKLFEFDSDTFDLPIVNPNDEKFVTEPNFDLFSFESLE